MSKNKLQNILGVTTLSSILVLSSSSLLISMALNTDMKNEYKMYQKQLVDGIKREDIREKIMDQAPNFIVNDRNQFTEIVGNSENAEEMIKESKLEANIDGIDHHVMYVGNNKIAISGKVIVDKNNKTILKYTENDLPADTEMEMKLKPVTYDMVKRVTVLESHKINEFKNNIVTDMVTEGNELDKWDPVEMQKDLVVRDYVWKIGRVLNPKNNIVSAICLLLFATGGIIKVSLKAIEKIDWNKFKKDKSKKKKKAFQK